MKFSYTLLKKLVPAVKSKAQAIEVLSLYAFEAEDGGGNTIEISVPPNRFSDAASHWGVARELAAILGGKLQIPKRRTQIPSAGVSRKTVPVQLREPRLCPRASAQYFEVGVGPSPLWITKILGDCGIRSINNVVDVTNYVMLEVGQPLHAFDYDRMDGGELVIRRAKPKEQLTILDGKRLILDPDVLVLADRKEALDIAGVKGGKKAEIFLKTKRILLTACNFNAIGIYKTARKLNLFTEASGRFSHGLSPLLVEGGMARAGELFLAIAKARAGGIVDINHTKSQPRLIPFHPEKLDALIGAPIPQAEIQKIFKSIGFAVGAPPSSKGKFTATPLGHALSARRAVFVTPPPLRDDVGTAEDVAEEIGRLFGYGNITPRPPRVHLLPSGFEDQITLKDKIRRILAGLGLIEVYRHSFISKDEAQRFGLDQESAEIQNPLSEEFSYLRPSLVPGLVGAALGNLRFTDSSRLFEIGKVFDKDKNGLRERLTLGIVFAAKAGAPLIDLKGLVKQLVMRAGLVDFAIVPTGEKDGPPRLTKNSIAPGTLLKIKSGDLAFGYGGQLSYRTKGHIALAEVDLEVLGRLVLEEHEYRPLPKYPSVMRDISLAVPASARVGDMMQAVQEADASIIEDVDIIDEYNGNITFRVVFQAEDRTLTDTEVNALMKKIEAILRKKFKVAIR